MLDPSVSQNGNIVNGPQAGHDAHDNRKFYYSNQTSTLKALVERFEAELKTNAEFRLVIDALQHYLKEVNEGKPIGLSGKLQKADRQDQIGYATSTKEIFNMQLHEHMFSKTAQEIFAYLLGRIHMLFEFHVKPAILEGKSRTEIDKIVAEAVLNPVSTETALDSIGIFPQHICGMLFFLTGNCHINWDKGDDNVNLSPGP